MKTPKWLTSASLALVMLSGLYAEPHCPGNAASIRPRFVGRSLMILPVTLNSSGPYDFMVDTGARLTTIDPSLASELHLARLGPTHVTGVGTYMNAEYGELETLQVGTYSIKQPLVLIQDLRWVQQNDRRIRGILGENFLEHYDLLIDYQHRILCLDDTGQMQQKVKGARIALVPSPYAERYLPFTQPLIVPARVPRIADQPLLFALDSGANVPVLFNAGGRSVSAEFFTSAGRRHQADEVVQGFAVLPPLDMKVGASFLYQISFVTPVATGKEIPAKPDVDGLLPTSLFRKAFISYAAHFAILEP
jgi:Aspartyl protease